MSEYVITTDNNSDLPEKYLKDHGVGCMYLSYSMDGKNYTHGNFLPEHEFYEAMRNGSMPTTAQVNPENAKITKYGKNLIPYPYDISGTTEKNGLSITVNVDGTITVNGTATADTYIRLHGENSRITLAPGTYTLSGCAPGGSISTYKLYTQNGMDLYSQPDAATKTILETKSIEVCFVVYNGVECNNLVFKPQLEVGNFKTEFELCDAQDTELNDGLTWETNNIYPVTTIIAENPGISLSVEYNRDLNKVIEKLEQSLS